MVLQDKSDIKYYFDARFDEWKVYLYRIGKRTDLSRLIFQKFTKKNIFKNRFGKNESCYYLFNYKTSFLKVNRKRPASDNENKFWFK